MLKYDSDENIAIKHAPSAVAILADKTEGDASLDMSYALQDELGFYMDILADDFAG